MNKPPKKSFSLYSYLLKKLRRELIIWYFFTFLASFFYYQATNGLKMWNYKETNELFFGTVSVTRTTLLCYSFFCFFVGFILTGLVCEYLKNYCLESCRFHLRKLLLNYSANQPQKTQTHRKEILSNFWGETELFVPPFIQVPQRVYNAIVNIIFTFVFLSSFNLDSFTIYFTIFFVTIISLTIALWSFLSYRTQTKINQQQNNFRYQENKAMESYLEKQNNPREVSKLIDSNFRQTKNALRKKTFAYLPNLVILGLSILFCFIYSWQKKWEVKDILGIFQVAGSIQTIFFKVKDITDNSPEISKIKIHQQSLKKVLSKLSK